ncbi:MAG: hypothetical protein AAF799_11015 [Myxococcota bacterium]
MLAYARPRSWLLATLWLPTLGCGDNSGVITTGMDTAMTSGTTTGQATPDASSSSGAASSSSGIADTTSDDGTTDEGGRDSSGTTTGPAIEDMGCPECTVLAHGLQGGRGIALDDEYVYFTDQAAGTVERVPKGGGPREVIDDGQDSPYGVGVNDEYVYWTSFNEEGTVQRQVIEGGITFALAADAFPRFMQVVDGWVYWCSFDDVLGRVRRVPADGVGESPETLVSVGSGVADLVVVNDVVYFTAHLPPTAPGLAPQGIVYTASAHFPTEEADLEAVAIEQAEPWGITQRGGTLYWINGVGNPQDLPRRVLGLNVLNGGPPSSLVVQQTAPWGIDVDDDFVYWTDFIEVKAYPRAGGDEVLLADLQNVGRQILVDEESVYWITTDRVLQRPKPKL